ncbi:MAG: hypothetical protein J5779_00230 [Clostridia bacterium]|nr:hypothetical protein [Clostridia bacterium]
MENKITLINRKNLNLFGISKVFAINEDSAQLQIDNSILTILGKNMEVKKLDIENGILELEGLINAIKYTDKKEKTSFIKKIFK